MFYVNVIDIHIVYVTLPMYVFFSIDITFKGSQCPLNMRSKVKAVSYLHIGVNDTTVHITSVSMTPLCMPRQCQWLCSACHSGVNDTAVQPTLSIYSANTKPFNSCKLACFRIMYYGALCIIKNARVEGKIPYSIFFILFLFAFHPSWAGGFVTFCQVRGLSALLISGHLLVAKKLKKTCEYKMKILSWD
jgi:hypothetical protein